MACRFTPETLFSKYGSKRLSRAGTAPDEDPPPEPNRAPSVGPPGVGAGVGPSGSTGGGGGGGGGGGAPVRAAGLWRQCRYASSLAHRCIQLDPVALDFDCIAVDEDGFLGIGLGRGGVR